ncbi:FAD-dependent monooxygenase [Thalassobacillus devorans]|uniref:FAD-dependent monooxygenase n=1 Tax=Thalassobacillus devorans TaxID=279813 RepID=UPI00048B6905|nr:FAD-dependent monooxygenase [Thalassobacillus devorans]
MEVLIVGAGIAGLTLADQLEQQGYSVLMVEQAPGPRTEGYMMDFFGAGYDVAERIGLLPDLESIHYPIESLNTIRPDGTTKYSLRYKDVRALLNNRHYNFMRGDLERVLLERVKDRIQIRYRTTVTSIKQDNSMVHVELSDETTVDVNLLVGADGIRSKVRSMAFGEPDQFIRFMGYNTAAFTFPRTSAFKSVYSFDNLAKPKRQVTLYPIAENRMAAFFLFNKERASGRITREQAIEELYARYGDMEWVVPDVLREANNASDFYYDDVSQVEMSRWVKGRIALVGDACQCVSLVAGQGASLAMAGAYTLAYCLRKSKGNLIRGLADYEEIMVPQVTKVQSSARKFASFYFPETRSQLYVRDLIMRVSVLPVIRNFINFKSIRIPR